MGVVAAEEERGNSKTTGVWLCALGWVRGERTEATKRKPGLKPGGMQP